jgi:hypothetical protein
MGESICFGFSLALPEVGKCVFVFQEPCPSWANVFLFFKSLARRGQAIYFFILPLPDMGKPFIFSIRLCPPWASLFIFYFAFARAGQAVYFFILPLPALGKPFIFFILPLPEAGKPFNFSFYLCPRWANRIAMFCFIFIVLLAFEDFLF